MTLSAPIGSISSQAPSIPAPGHRHHHRGFTHDLAAATGPLSLAAAQTAPSAGQLLSSDLVRQLQTLTGQATAAAGAPG